MKKYSFVFLVLVLFSCTNKQEEFIQAEFNKVQGNWVIDNLVMPANAPDTLKNFYQSGELVFNNCKYNQKEFTKSPAVCGGEAAINQVVLFFAYKYDYNLSQFVWEVGFTNYTVKTFNIRKASQIFDGNWEVVVDGNKMTAIRRDVVKSYLDQATLYKGEVMFTATRK